MVPPEARDVQVAHDYAHLVVENLVLQYQAGLVTLDEFAWRIHAVYAQVPVLVPGVIDRNTGLRY